MPALCAPKLETVDYVHTARVGPDRLPLGVLAPLWKRVAWVAYWYTYHDGCMVNRCPCWAAARRGYGEQWHGDGVAIIGRLSDNGTADRAIIIVSLAHGAEGLAPLDLANLRPTRKSARASIGGPAAGRDTQQHRLIATAVRIGVDTQSGATTNCHAMRRAYTQTALARLPGLDEAERAALEPLYSAVWPAADLIHAITRRAPVTRRADKPSPARGARAKTGAVVARRKTSR